MRIAINRLGIPLLLGIGLLFVVQPRLTLCAQKRTRVVSLKECIEQALSDSLIVQKREQRASLAQAEIRGARQALLPEIQAQGFWGYLPDFVKPFSIMDLYNKAPIPNRPPSPLPEGLDIPSSINSYLNRKIDLKIGQVWVGDLSLRQPLFAGGRIIIGNKIAEKAAYLDSQKESLEERKTKKAIAESYAQAVSLVDQIKTFDLFIGSLSRLVDDLDSLHSVGVIAPRDLLEVRLERNRAQGQRQQMLRSFKQLKDQIRFLMQEPSSSIRLREEESSAITASIFEDAVPFSLEKDTLALSILTAGHEIQTLQESLAWRKALPSVGVLGHIYTTNPTFNEGFKREFSFHWFVGVGVTVPITSLWIARGEYKKSLLQEEIRKIDYEKARQGIAQQSESAHNLLQASEASIQESTIILRDAERNRELSENGYHKGVLQPSVYLRACSLWLQARLSLIEAYYNRHIAQIALAYPL